MTIIEKQAELGRTLFEINVNTLQEIAKTQQEDVRKYFELNSNYGARLPEVRDVASFMELQREYGETLWKNVRESTQAQADIVRHAVEKAGDAFRTTFVAATEKAEAAQ